MIDTARLWMEYIDWNAYTVTSSEITASEFLLLLHNSSLPVPRPRYTLAIAHANFVGRRGLEVPSPSVCLEVTQKQMNPKCSNLV